VQRTNERSPQKSPPELEVTSEIVTGDIADKVQEIATQEKFDFIIVGTHGRKGLAHLFLGSVAEKIIRSAPCPVLTVRTPEKK
jgi:universal stress protein A